MIFCHEIYDENEIYFVSCKIRAQRLTRKRKTIHQLKPSQYPWKTTFLFCNIDKNECKSNIDYHYKEYIRRLHCYLLCLSNVKTHWCVLFWLEILISCVSSKILEKFSKWRSHQEACSLRKVMFCDIIYRTGLEDERTTTRSAFNMLSSGTERLCLCVRERECARVHTSVVLYKI